MTDTPLVNVFQHAAYTCTELISQPYLNGTISTGLLEGHPVDSVYLRLQRGEEDLLLTLRPDEMAALAFVATGLLWSREIGALLEDDPHPDTDE